MLRITGEFVKQIPGPYPEIFIYYVWSKGSRICISYKIPDGADAIGSHSTLWVALPQIVP